MSIMYKDLGHLYKLDEVSVGRKTLSPTRRKKLLLKKLAKKDRLPLIVDMPITSPLP